MKRSHAINLTRMRKASGVFALKPLALCIAAVLAGCGNSEQPADIFKNLEECKTTYPDLTAQCEMAFNHALTTAETTAPKYNSMDDCAAEFGADRCQRRDRGDGSSWFMPAMAGFMLARTLDNHGYQSAPMFTSSYAGSPYYHRWSTVDGRGYGDYRSSRTYTQRDAFKPQPAVTKTISRGGFGAKSAAASSWGSSKSSGSSWGG